MPADAGGGFRRMYTHSPVVSQSLREMNVRNSPVNQKPRYLAEVSHRHPQTGTLMRRQTPSCTDIMHRQTPSCTDSSPPTQLVTH